MLRARGAWGIDGIDFLTASRNALLPFSIRCQRSATCVALGSALVTAWPYPPPRSRDTTRIEGRVKSQASTLAALRSGRTSTASVVGLLIRFLPLLEKVVIVRRLLFSRLIAAHDAPTRVSVQLGSLDEHEAIG